ncbi:hypothetical protein B0H66DRAFT_238578 [Apodospora peruviana]|uniref:BZIP domain-containing protein n=1 Tax=Apodospora peruviana TaxID=516989 RepID=A0AAE0I4I1_9PEZI|nr:hypothetical protein B0H66DRAFT_238578 [Apodospora peruviana]
MSTIPERTNLARIRENQRRSRARRREYVQELEQRLRLVELQGIEASAEIQVAARKVADENRRLRVLLNNHGFEDESIERYLASSSSTAPPQHHGGAGSSAQMLRQLLVPRRPSLLDYGGPTTPSFLEGQQQQPLMAPTSSAVDNAGMSFEGSNTDDLRPPFAAANPYTNVGRETVGGYDYGMAGILQCPPLEQQHEHNRIRSSLSAAPTSYSSSSPPRSSSTRTSPGNNNCSMATDLISSMVGADPFQVRATLGCAPGADCAVDNMTVSNAIDQLTASALRM